MNVKLKDLKRVVTRLFALEKRVEALEPVKPTHVKKPKKK